jgi:hypothetical protein
MGRVSSGRYSSISSASTASSGGIIRPSLLAVVRLITRSNFVGRSMASSAGFAPLSILSHECCRPPDVLLKVLPVAH